MLNSEPIRTHTAESNFAAEAADQIVRLIGAPKELLLIGESSVLAEALRARGCRVICAGSAPEAVTAAGADLASASDGTDAGWIAQLGANQFEVIVVAGLLEFARDPAAVLRGLRAILPDQGCLAALIPNVAHVKLRLALLGGRFPYDDWDRPERIPLRFYTRKTIEALFPSGGFEIRDLKRREERINFRELASGLPALPPDLIESLDKDPEALTSHFFVLAGPMIREYAEPGRDDGDAQRRGEIALLQRLVERQAGQLEALGTRVELLEGELRAKLRDALSTIALTSDSSVAAGLRAAQTALANLNSTRSGGWGKGRNGDPVQEMRYQRLVHRIRGVVRATLPPDATIMAVSRGDDVLLKFDGQTGWHFLMTSEGAYAGHHPADSAEAIGHLEELRARGGEFLLIPSTAFWWLDYYADFARHLERHYRIVVRREDSCVIFGLKET